MYLQFWMNFELSLQDSRHCVITLALMSKFCCCDQQQLMRKCTESAELKLKKHKLRGVKPWEHWHLSYSQWSLTRYKSAKLPDKHIDTAQYMRYHSPVWSVFIFPLCLSELWIPFTLRTVEKCCITSSRETTRALGCWWNFCSHRSLQFSE